MWKGLVKWLVEITYGRGGDPFFQEELILKNREERRSLPR
jgi:hypothetical protein